MTVLELRPNEQHAKVMAFVKEFKETSITKKSGLLEEQKKERRIIDPGYFLS
jgi:hypothetical protein